MTSVAQYSLIKLRQMKGNKELLTVLNSLLADELTVINQ